jgi:hypothetical protein
MSIVIPKREAQRNLRFAGSGHAACEQQVPDSTRPFVMRTILLRSE